MPSHDTVIASFGLQATPKKEKNCVRKRLSYSVVAWIQQTVLAIARDEGYDTYAMSFRYGQRHTVELECAENVAKALGVKQHTVVDIDLRTFGSSALTADIEVPKGRSDADMENGIPITYVPARNTIFLSYALAWAEVLVADTIFIGANAIDYSGYPDCRPEYIEAYQTLANLATQAGVEGENKIENPRPAYG